MYALSPTLSPPSPNNLVPIFYSKPLRTFHTRPFLTFLTSSYFQLVSFFTTTAFRLAFRLHHYRSMVFYGAPHHRHLLLLEPPWWPIHCEWGFMFFPFPPGKSTQFWQFFTPFTSAHFLSHGFTCFDPEKSQRKAQFSIAKCHLIQHYHSLPPIQWTTTDTQKAEPQFHLTRAVLKRLDRMLLSRRRGYDWIEPNEVDVK